ncbi:plasmid replication protein RepC [Castellaniella sp.]|uniref:plasmid replication protein RepC n=1 Tax=Castellaniella sp. TaxID=1955812 RepID=UPI002AFE69ED|nr:plasmid replication protein RepC [Castellaniella sp.]
MQGSNLTTPFGQRQMTLGHVATQIEAKSINPDTVVHKWQIFLAIREARHLLGTTDRALTVLNALLSFHPETALSGPEGLIVWPSNEALASRANGMSETTLRRHLTVLVDCGLIIRRDSPNGKRYARKGEGGKINQAFGFDLSPIVARAAEIHELANAAQAQKRALRLAREKHSLLRRDISKMLELAIIEAVPGDWSRVSETFQSILADLPRGAVLDQVEDANARLGHVHNELCEALENFTKTENMNGNAHQNGCQIRNTADTSSVDNRRRSDDRQSSSYAFGDFASDGEALAENGGSQVPRPAQGPNIQGDVLNISLSLVKSACPEIADTLPEAFASWIALRGSGQSLCRMAYINPQVWEEAQMQLGPDLAIAALAVTVQKAWSEEVRNAGAYLRSLIQRHRKGELFLSRSLFAMAQNASGGTH